MCEYLRYTSTFFRNVSFALEVALKVTSLYTEQTEIVSIPLLLLFERENRGSVNRL